MKTSNEVIGSPNLNFLESDFQKYHVDHEQIVDVIFIYGLFFFFHLWSILCSSTQQSARLEKQREKRKTWPLPSLVSERSASIQVKTLP